jgi:hypothetical protein
MSDDTLFDADIYGEGKAPRKSSISAVPPLVPRPPGYHLVANTKGVQGFHRTKVPEAAMAKNGSCVTFCGIVGRRMGEYPEMIPLCPECEKIRSRS